MPPATPPSPALPRRHLLVTLAAPALASLAPLAGCAHGPGPAHTVSGADEVLAPNAQLHVEGVPPIPMGLVRQVERYTEFRGHGFLDWHPTRREMLVSHRAAGASTAQVFRVRSPLAEPERLTNFTDPVGTALYEPGQGRYLVLERASGGNEVTQLHRLDLDTQAVTLLTDPNQRHDLLGWLNNRPVAGQPAQPDRLLHTSVPIDRTAAGGSREQIAADLWLLDPLQPEGRRKVTSLPGTGWFELVVAPDDRKVALMRYRSATESEVWEIDLASGERRQLLPRPGQPAAFHAPAGFTEDGRGLWVVTDRMGEFRQLARLDLASGEMRLVTGHIPWDVDGGDTSHDGRWLMVRANEDGRGQLHLIDPTSLSERPLPAELPAGSIGAAHFHRRYTELAFSVNGASGPSQIHSLDLATGRLQAWTRPVAPQGLDPAGFAPQQVIRWKGFDGLAISGLLTRPPARHSGRRPVLINIHGGPEGQATFGFLGRWQYLVEELGVAFIQPNVRGSSGFGKRFLSLDNGFLREDSVKDIGSLLDWIATQPDLDPDRVVVMGGSYGGYMSLAVSTHYADRIVGAIDVVGISHFLTFLQNTESYRRDLRRAEYGDERDPAMKAFLERISPLSNAQRIRQPLFVVQGRNDPRVPWTEAEQMVRKARDNGARVWYLRAENEGHGFVRKENADYQFYATLLFLQQTLLR